MTMTKKCKMANFCFFGAFNKILLGGRFLIVITVYWSFGSIDEALKMKKNHSSALLPFRSYYDFFLCNRARFYRWMRMFSRVISYYILIQTHIEGDTKCRVLCECAF